MKGSMKGSTMKGSTMKGSINTPWNIRGGASDMMGYGAVHQQVMLTTPGQARTGSRNTIV